MRILVTGLTSFTGRHLLPMIQEAGWEITALVRRPSGFKNEIIWDFLSPLPALPACDAVVHLAADINFSRELNLDLYRVNTLATAKLVSYAHEHKAFFIFASSVAVHGPSEKIGMNSPLLAAEHYGASKLMAEDIIKSFLKDYAILRIAGIYGLNGPGHLGLNKSITAAVEEHAAPVLKGSGQAKRNYICVVDVARWIVFLLKEYSAKKEMPGKIYYLADSQTHSIRGYLEDILSVLMPQEKIKILEGINGKDSIVEASLPPFPLTQFMEYLQTMKRSRYVAS